MIALPMRLKVAEDQRFLTIHFDSVASAKGDGAKETAGVGVAGEEQHREAEVPVPASKTAVHDDSPTAETKAPAVNSKESCPVKEDSREDNSGDDEPARKRARKTAPTPDSAADDLKEKDRKSAQTPPAISESNDATLSRPPSAPPGTRPPPRGARPKASAAAARAAAFSDVPAELRDKIKTGEGIIKDAKEAEDRNQWGQAFDCYERGLAYFMEVLPKLGKDSLGGASLRKQINGYLKKASELKEKLERSKAFGCRNLARPPRN
jgi:hypothetical protein